MKSEFKYLKEKSDEVQDNELREVIKSASNYVEVAIDKVMSELEDLESELNDLEDELGSSYKKITEVCQ